MPFHEEGFRSWPGVGESSETPPRGHVSRLCPSRISAGDTWEHSATKMGARSRCPGGRIDEPAITDKAAQHGYVSKVAL
jgi:hypothetical protein